MLKGFASRLIAEGYPIAALSARYLRISSLITSAAALETFYRANRGISPHGCIERLLLSKPVREFVRYDVC